MLKAFKRWNARRETRAQLYSMSERELNDIGIGYGDIDRILSQI